MKSNHSIWFFCIKKNRSPLGPIQAGRYYRCTVGF